LTRLTPFTQCTAATLRARLEHLRSADWCMDTEQHELSVHALAVPLRNLQGQTIAAQRGVAGPLRGCGADLRAMAVGVAAGGA
jgi:IclR family pca regulon transcriptional regulator